MSFVIDNNYILRVTGFDIALRDHLNKYYFNLPESQKLAVESQVGKFARRYNIHRHQACCSAIFHYCCRLMAIHSVFEESRRLSQESQALLKTSTVIRAPKLVSHSRKRRSFGRKSSLISARLEKSNIYVIVGLLGNKYLNTLGGIGGFVSRLTISGKFSMT